MNLLQTIDWILLGKIFAGVVTFIGVVAGIVQIVQYLEERKHRKVSTNNSEQIVKVRLHAEKLNETPAQEIVNLKKLLLLPRRPSIFVNRE